MEGAEVLYFDPPVTWLAPLADKTAKDRLTAWRKPPFKPTKSVTVFSVPPVLPFYNRFRWINRFNQARLARYVGKIMANMGFDFPVLWVYSPMYADIVPKLSKSSLVYDCVDRHSAYKGQINPAVVDKMEEDLAKACESVFCTAKGLYERLVKFNPKTFLIPNGVDFDRFNAVCTKKLTVPDDMINIPKPVLGFVGVLRNWVDTSVIEYAARSRPDWSVVLIGPEGDADLSGLKTLKNVHFLGAKPNDTLPAYISSFDIALNAFVKSDLSKDVSPLKFYEYLATGKPVVSTGQPLQVLSYADCVYIAEDAKGYLTACEEALAETGEERRNLRIAGAKAASWDGRVAEIVKICIQNGIFYNSPAGNRVHPAVKIKEDI